MPVFQGDRSLEGTIFHGMFCGAGLVDLEIEVCCMEETDYFSSTLSYLGRSQDDRSPRILVLVR